MHFLGKDAEPEPILDILRNFYVRLKRLESDLHFVFVTGNTRFARVSLFSAFNNLWDISWEPAYATLCGFTEQEVRTALHPHLATGAAHLNVSLEELMDKVRCYYNGNCFGFPEDSERIYNSFTSPVAPGHAEPKPYPEMGDHPRRQAKARMLWRRPRFSGCGHASLPLNNEETVEIPHSMQEECFLLLQASWDWQVGQAVVNPALGKCEKLYWWLEIHILIA